MIALNRRTSVGVASLLSLAMVAASARPGEAAGLLVAEGGFGGVLEIKEHEVNVTINNGVAVTEVNQVFVNTEDRIVEALYTFPVPKGASVSNFSMWIGGKEMIGEVVEKKRAREIYESYKQTRRDPGLLEQVDYKTFEMRIFPIPAGAEQRVRVTYYQELDFDHDWASYVYPLATNTRSSIDQRTTGKFALSLEVKSEVPITKLESTSHADDFVVVSHADNYYQASLETNGGDLGRDLVLAYQLERPKTGLDLITSKQPGEDGFFMLTLTAGKELAELDRGMDYVFLLDVSGSMANDGKLRTSRGSIDAFIDALGPEDRFDLITFNVTAETLFGELRPANETGLASANEYLATQKARGGTLLRPALEAAYRYRDPDRTLNVVVLSDGMTEQREQRELLQLITQRPSGSRVFCIGVGNDVNRPLLRQLAGDAGGLASFVSQGDNFERQAKAFRRKLMRPAATELQIKFAGGDVYDVEPQQLPNLYHGAPLRLYGRYRQSGPVQVSIDGDVQGAPLAQQVNLNLPRVDDDNPQIERMWAWHRVHQLMDVVRRDGKQPRLEEEIVRLCEGFSIASEYASFIVLENDGEYRRWKIERRNATRIERDRAARAKLRTRLDQIRDASAAKVGPQQAEGQRVEVADSRSGRDSSRSDSPASPTPERARRSGDRSNSRDITFPGGGGGALDPVTGSICLGMSAAAAAAAWRRRRRGPGELTSPDDE